MANLMYVDPDELEDKFHEYVFARSGTRTRDSRKSLRPLYRRYSEITKKLRGATREGISRHELEYLLDQARRLKNNIYGAQWWGKRDGRFRGITPYLARPLMDELQYLCMFNYRITHAYTKKRNNPFEDFKDMHL